MSRGHGLSQMLLFEGPRDADGHLPLRSACQPLCLDCCKPLVLRVAGQGSHPTRCKRCRVRHRRRLQNESHRRGPLTLTCQDCGEMTRVRASNQVRCEACAETKRRRDRKVARRGVPRTGLTQKRLGARSALQHGRCAICGGTNEHLGRRLDLDHLHDDARPYKLRALLCNGCNAGIGCIGENERLVGADSPVGIYLRFWRAFYPEGCDPAERRRAWLTETGPLFDGEGQRLDVPQPGRLALVP